jgi:hypothetical protein
MNRNEIPCALKCQCGFVAGSIGNLCFVSKQSKALHWPKPIAEQIAKGFNHIMPFEVVPAKTTIK